MIGLFKNAPTGSSAVKTFTKIPYIRERLSSNLDKVLYFYSHSGRAVRSNHILVRLIDSILSPMGNSLERYLDIVEDAAPSVAHGLGIGSSIYTPKMTLGSHFYPKADGELLFLVNSHHDTLPTRWQTVTPINVYYHSRTDIDFSLLETHTPTTGYVVIGIDPVLLMYMYRGWYKNMRLQEDGTELSTRHFIAQWVLPKLLISHIEISWLNRIRHARWSVPVDTNEKRGPIALPTSISLLEDVQDQIFDYLSKKELKFSDIIQNVPALFSQNMFDIIRVPDLAPTRNTNAFYMAASSPWLNLLMSIQSLHSGNVNRTNITEINRMLRKCHSERWLANLGNSEAVNDVKEQVDTLVGFIERA